MANNPGDHQLIVRARTVLPINSRPIENGAALILGDRIVTIGPWKDFPASFTAANRGKIFDLGDVILMPGLVNAHCHLDYTGMAGMWPPPRNFIEWIPRMLAAKAEWSYSDYARSWVSGAKMLLRSGTTTVADIEAAPELLPEVWEATPLRVCSFFEMTGVRSKRDPNEILYEALGKMDSLSHERCTTSISPHAPYSTSPELLRLCAETGRERSLRVAIHVAESQQEFDMYKNGSGEMFEWLKRNGRDNSDCGLGSPVQDLERAGLVAENLLAIHANYLDDYDISLLAAKKASVVHCPRSHEYFQHAKFPIEKLLAANVNVCLGTDSLATVRKADKQELELSMFQEMQTFARVNSALQPQMILKMATMNSARALGLSGKAGVLAGGAFADMIAIPFTGKISEAESTALNFSGHVRASMIGGSWAIAPE